MKAAFFVILIIAFILFLTTVKIVPQGKEYVIERLGKYSRTLKPGLNIIVPFMDTVREKVDMRETLLDGKPQPVITQDNVTIHIDSVVYYCVSNPRLYVYGVNNPALALETLTATTLRDVIGGMTLDQVLVSRQTINTQIGEAIDGPTASWGIVSKRFEIQNIEVPDDLANALERQMRAERERRALVIESEGKKQSQILQAEGEKQAMVLRAEAEKEVAVKEAEGKAEAIRLMYEAQASGIREINDAEPSAKYVQLEGFKYLKDLANGQATKIIVPSNLQSLAGTITSVSELVKDDPLNVTTFEEAPEPDPYAKLRTEHNPKTHKFDDEKK